MKKLFFVASVFFIAFMFQQSCSKDKYEIPGKIPSPNDTTNNKPVNICDTATIKYSNYIKNIINTNCGSCHTNYTDYSGVKAIADDGKLKNRVVDGNPSPMPPNGLLPQATRDSILWWINGGKCQ
ncbi:MAG: hypothetical protein ACK4ON_03800 [Bacteroidia bacterium]